MSNRFKTRYLMLFGRTLICVKLLVKMYSSVGLLSFSGALIVCADDQVVTDLADSGAGSLRQAINDVGSGEQITFDPALSGATITLGGTELLVDKNLTIDAASLADGITVSGNHASRIFNVSAGAVVELDSLTVRDGYINAEGDQGGAVRNTGTLTVRNSTFSNNKAAIFGGAFDNSGTLTILNSTIAHNEAPSSSGGIHNQGGTLTLIHTTLASNQSAEIAGGLWSGEGGNVTLTDSIVANNTALSGPDISTFETITVTGVNLIGDLADSNLSESATLMVGDPKLADLGDYGGPTATMPPLQESPAIDAALNSTVLTDQRGFTRPVGAARDIGAIESLAIPEGVSNTSLLPSLTWESSASASYELYWGTDAEKLSIKGAATSPYTPAAPLVAGTTYYWRVDTTIGASTSDGPVQSFTTRTGIEVTTATDENDGITVGAVSLREAIADAVPSGPPETIRFAAGLSGATITLGGTELLVDKNLTIDAASLADGITVSGNHASRIFNVSAGAVVELDSLTVRDGYINAEGDQGGAVRNTGTLTVRNSTFSNNKAAIFGGAFDNSGTLTILNSTIAHNEAPSSSGGIHNQGGTLTLIHTTLASNQSAEIAGGLWSGEGGNVTLTDSIVANNTALSGPDISTFETITVTGVNLIGDLADSNLSESATLIVGDPKLADLGDYGGPTATMPPLPESPAIDAASGSSTITDQRGLNRIAAAANDIGSVEVLVTTASPLGGGVNTSLLPTFQWSGSESATYEIFIGPASGNLMTVGVQSSPFSVAQPLLAGTNYRWRIDTTVGAETYPGTVQYMNTRQWIEVTTGLDETNGITVGAISLREAIADAVPSGTPEIIRFATELNGGIITLKGSELLVDKNVIIDAQALSDGLTLSGNHASRIFNVSEGSVVVLDSLNLTAGVTPAGSDGAGILNAGDLTVRNSSIFGNASGRYGGGFENTGTLTLLNTTVAQNTATYGGGINNFGGTLNLTHCTIAGNQAAVTGGGFWSNQSLTLTDSIVANNSAPTAADISTNAPGTITLTGVNLISDLDSSNLIAGAAVLVGNPLLADLGNHGGPTATMPPLLGSPAIDAATGSLSGSGQRGVTRPYATMADLGAVEAVYFSVSNSLDSGAGSLREALTQAAAHVPSVAGLIDLDHVLSGQTITLASELLVANSMWLDASSLADGITLSGNNTSRVLNVSAGSVVDLDTWTITAGLTLAGSDGAGILNDGDLTMRNSTLFGNISGGHGGGIANTGSLTLLNSTVANNTAGHSGGGIASLEGSVAAFSSTIADNLSIESGGGLYAGAGVVTLTGSIVAKNIASNVPYDVNLTGSASVSAEGGNLFSTLHGTDLIAGLGVLVGDPLLADLADYGGPTHTMQLLPGSPAIDAATTNTNLQADQRRFERLLGAAADLGAYETPAGDYTLAGVSLFATMDASLTSAGVTFEISSDPDFLATVNAFAGTGHLALVDGQRSEAAFNNPSSVAQDSSGNIFVADTANNVIRMVAPDGVISTIAGNGEYGATDGSGPNARFKFPLAIVVGGFGLREDVYVSDLYNHSVRKLTRPALEGEAWTVETLAGTGSAGFLNGAGSVARFNKPYGLALDDLGNVYVADSNNHRIRKIDQNKQVTTYAGAADSVNESAGNTDGVTVAASISVQSPVIARFNEPTAVVFDRSGNLYIADRANHRIRTITPAGVVSTLAGGAAGLVDGIAAVAQFNAPNGLAIDGGDNLYVADGTNHAIRKVTTPEGVVSTVAGLGSQGMVNGNAEVARFNVPSGLLVDRFNSVGDLIVADSENHRLRRIIVDPITVEATVTDGGGSVSAVLDLASLQLNRNTTYYIRWRSKADQSTQALGQRFLMVDEPAIVTRPASLITSTSATLNATVQSQGSPTTVRFKYSTDPQLAAPRRVGTLVDNLTAASGVAVDFLGNVYLADQEAHKILKISPIGVVEDYAGSGVAGFADGPGSHAQFDKPMDVAIDAGGNLYVADALNHRIRKITPDKVVTTIAGSGVAGFADASIAKEGQFLFPTGLAVDSDGVELYIADRGNHRIRLVSDGALTTLAGSGTSGLINGLAAAAQFSSPTGVALGRSGNLIVADRDNHVIRQISAGMVVTLAGSGSEGFRDGANALAQFASPSSVAVDANGLVFVADSDNHRVRRIDVSSVSTIAGSGAAGFEDSPDSTFLYPATVAQFDRPYGLAVAPGAYGSLYLTEAGSQRIRTIMRGDEAFTVNWPQSTSLDAPNDVYVALPETLLSGATYYFQATATNARNPQEPSIGNILSFTNPLSQDIAVYAGVDDSSSELQHAQLVPVDLGITPQDVPLTETFTLANSGELDLKVAFVAATGGLVVDNNVGLLAPGESATFKVTIDATVTGTLVETISIASDDPDESSFEIPVTIYVQARPTVVTKPAIDSNVDGATLNAKAKPMDSATAVWFVYSPDPELDGVSVSTLAGSVVGYADGTGTLAQFNQPKGLVSDAAGNCYVADSENHRIRLVTPEGRVSTFAGTGSAGYVDGAALEAQFDNPVGLALGADGTLFVSDANNHRIRAISPTGQVSNYAGLGTPGLTDGVGSAARFNSPQGLAIDGEGIVYVADSGNGRIRSVSLDGLVSSLVDSAGHADLFTAPSAIALSDTDTLYLTEAGKHHILRFDAGDAAISFAGAADSAAYLNASGNAARFNEPSGLAIDADGNVLVADRNNHRIRKISPAGRVSSLAGSGHAGLEDGLGEVAQFDQPLSLTVDGNGQVLVGEAVQSTLRSIVSSNVIVEAGTDFSGTEELTIAQTVTGLASNTRYYFYVMARNSAGETVGSIQNFTTTLGFGNWSAEAFGPEGSQQTSALGNPDFDVLNNWLEYAFDTDPTQISNEAVPVIGLEAGFLTLTYRARINAPELIYTVSWSKDLLTWSPLGVEQEVLPNTATDVTQWIQAKVSLNGDISKFIRVTVSTLE